MNYDKTKKLIQPKADLNENLKISFGINGNKTKYFFRSGDQGTFAILINQLLGI